MKIQELYDSRVTVVEEQKALNDLALAEKRDFTPEEQEKYDKMDANFVRITDEIKTAEAAEKRQLERTAEIEKREGLLKSHKAVAKTPPDGDTRDKKDKKDETRKAEYRDAFNAVLRNEMSMGEIRALQADSAVAGGFLVAPEDFIASLIKSLDNRVFIRGLATKYTVAKAESLGVPVLDNDPDDFDWTSEIKTGSEDSSMSFEKRDLFPHPLAKRIKISEKLVRVSLIPIDALVRERLSYKLGVTQEKAFFTGNGANKPLGIFTASASGISTDRDVSDGNTVSAITADNLINVKYSMESQYRMGCQWIFHRDLIKMIRKLKVPGTGDYIWKPGISADKSDTILDFPVNESEYAPNTLSTGKYVGILGDFSWYWIVDALSMQVKVLNELYAETAQIGYIGRLETDGMPVHEKAFARVTLA
uniref:Putative capsid protein n=1 Tax=viral metagenome TaxID=1070528 RepID=A0A6M3IHI0_9ZZZZ